MMDLRINMNATTPSSTATPETSVSGRRTTTAAPSDQLAAANPAVDQMRRDLSQLDQDVRSARLDEKQKELSQLESEMDGVRQELAKTRSGHKHVELEKKLAKMQKLAAYLRAAIDDLKDQGVGVHHHRAHGRRPDYSDASLRALQIDEKKTELTLVEKQTDSLRQQLAGLAPDDPQRKPLDAKLAQLEARAETLNKTIEDLENPKTQTRPNGQKLLKEIWEKEALLEKYEGLPPWQQTGHVAKQIQRLKREIDELKSELDGLMSEAFSVVDGPHGTRMIVTDGIRSAHGGR